MAALKLGKLPDREMTKITFTLSAELKALLDQYAYLYEKEYGRKEAINDLVPHMLETFIKNDRGFRRSRKPAERNNTKISDV